MNNYDLPLAVKKAPPEKLLFVSDRGGNNDIYLVNAGGGDPLNLTNNPADDSNPTWSPDGQEDCLHLPARRQPGDLRDELRWQQPGPPHQQPGQ